MPSPPPDRTLQQEIKHLRHAVSTLEWSTRRQMAAAEKLIEAAGERREHEVVRERVFRRLHRLTRGQRPIIVGPWTGEVGFELLYWAPFVRWASARFRIDPARLVLVSRGGTASWYGIAGARYIDLLEHVPPDEFVRRTAKERKQRGVRLFDRRVLRHFRGELGDAAWLHPSLMYALFLPYWNQRTPLSWVHQFAQYARVVPQAMAGLQLPDDYVAVRFYFSKCFPETTENRAFVDRLIRSLATESDVVLLGSGVQLDEHREIPLEVAPRVHDIRHLQRPETNLALQTAVIAGARAAIGTYGGFSYLAPLCGVDAIALYSRKNYYPHHLYLAQQVFDSVGGGSLTVIDAAAWPLISHIATAARTAVQDPS